MLHRSDSPNILSSTFINRFSGLLAGFASPKATDRGSGGVADGVRSIREDVGASASEHASECATGDRDSRRDGLRLSGGSSSRGVGLIMARCQSCPALQTTEDLPGSQSHEAGGLADAVHAEGTEALGCADASNARRHGLRLDASSVLPLTWCVHSNERMNDPSGLGGGVEEQPRRSARGLLTSNDVEACSIRLGPPAGMASSESCQDSALPSVLKRTAAQHMLGHQMHDACSPAGAWAAAAAAAPASAHASSSLSMRSSHSSTASRYSEISTASTVSNDEAASRPDCVASSQSLPSAARATNTGVMACDRDRVSSAGGTHVLVASGQSCVLRMACAARPVAPWPEVSCGQHSDPLVHGRLLGMGRDGGCEGAALAIGGPAGALVCSSSGERGGTATMADRGAEREGTGARGGPSRLKLFAGGLKQLQLSLDALPDIDEACSESGSTPCAPLDRGPGVPCWTSAPFLGGEEQGSRGWARGCGKRGRPNAWMSPPDSTASYPTPLLPSQEGRR